jgi:hypothetical protein
MVCSLFVPVTPRKSTGVYGEASGNGNSPPDDEIARIEGIYAAEVFSG